MNRWSRARGIFLWITARKRLWRSSALAFAGFLASANVFGAGFVPPKNLNPEQPTTPSLDTTFEREAWLVYGYEVDPQGAVTNAKIHASNDVSEVEDKILEHVSALNYRPATRDGRPVRVSIGPIVYTWILDLPREMSAEYEAIYQEAWGHFNRQNYDLAFEFAAELKKFPGRSAYEEVKYRILAASLASRWEDDTAELAHLQRIVDFQRLADRNKFSRPYVEPPQYQLILERIQTIQLGKWMLADAEATLADMESRDGGSDATARARSAQEDARGRFLANPDVEIAGVLTPLYPGGRGDWETGLSRSRFSISNVKGSIIQVFLACAGGNERRMQFPSREVWSVPEGWRNCKVEVAGRSGTRFRIHQLTGS